MKQRHAAIHLTSPNRASVTVDGHDVGGIVGIQLAAAHGELPRLVLDVQLLTADLDGYTAITVPEATAETLLALGWTPPPGQAYGGSGRPVAWRHSCGELNEGQGHGACRACGFDVDSHPEDVENRYVLVELSEGWVPSAAPR